MSDRERLYHTVTLLFSLVIVGFGVAAVAKTLAAGGGPASVGVLIGLLFMALGGARLYVAARALR
jgi:amino acid transporter